MVVFTTILRYLNRWNPNRSSSQAIGNPYTFGTREWRVFADAQATDHELMVMRIADLEAQVQQTTELVGSLEALAASQDTLIHDLRLQNKVLQDGPDPEVLQRILDKLHTPLNNFSQPEDAGLQLAEPEPSSATVAPAARSAGTIGSGRDSSQGTATVHKTVTRNRPLTLAEELEAHLGEDSEDESEADDV